MFPLKFFQFFICWGNCYTNTGEGAGEGTILMKDPNPKERKGRNRD